MENENEKLQSMIHKQNNKLSYIDNEYDIFKLDQIKAINEKNSKITELSQKLIENEKVHTIKMKSLENDKSVVLEK